MWCGGYTYVCIVLTRRVRDDDGFDVFVYMEVYGYPEL